MEGSIKYILIETYGAGIATTDVEPDAENLYRSIRDAKRSSDEFHILGAQRCVISANGLVKFTEVRIDWDEDGVGVYDRYGYFIDRYSVPEPEPTRKFMVERRETWVNRKEIRANDPDEALDIANQDVEDGVFDVLDGWLEDAETYVVQEIKEDET